MNPSVLLFFFRKYHNYYERRKTEIEILQIFLFSICLEIRLASLGIRLHCRLTRLPPSRTNLPVLVSELESLNQSESLVHISPNRKVIHSDLSQGAAAVNDKETPECQTFVFLEHSVCPADCHALVRQERDLHVSQPTGLPALLTPGEVGEVGVSGAGDHCTVESLKLCHPVREGDDLGGADEGEVQGIEEEDNVLALVVIQGDVFELTIDNSCPLEFRGRHLGLQSHRNSLRSDKISCRSESSNIS